MLFGTETCLMILKTISIYYYYLSSVLLLWLCLIAPDHIHTFKISILDTHTMHYKQQEYKRFASQVQLTVDGPAFNVQHIMWNATNKYIYCMHLPFARKMKFYWIICLRNFWLKHRLVPKWFGHFAPSLLRNSLYILKLLRAI